MRNHPPPPQQQLLRLITLASLQCFIIFKALFLNVQLAEAEYNGTSSCNSTALHPACPLFQNMSILFPFFASQACGLASSFALSGCDSARSKPSWPNFHKAIIPGSNSPSPPFDPFVVGFSQAASTRFINSSNNSNIYRNFTNSGSINLTWSNTLIQQKACDSYVSLNDISDYLPQSINLTSFAHSSFQFSPSNLFLLFNCSSNSPSSVSANSVLEKNSIACRSYETDCKFPKKESPNCYQYRPERMSRELDVSWAMKSMDCEYAMFFVVRQLSTPASQWSPGLIELNWSTSSNQWMASNLELCEGCLQTNRACGYDDRDNFLCYCANDPSYSSNCPADNRPNHTSSCNKRFKCIGLMIVFGAVGFAIALSLSFTLFCIWRRKASMKTNVPRSSPYMTKSWMKKPSFLWRKQDPILAKEMSYQEIMHATESFADKHMLGDGGFGAVYKGVLADGRKVAVKRLYHDNYRRMEHFSNEIKVLSNLNHPNLVKLYGFCYEDEKELLLVFEYAPRGTISDQLHDASKPPMSWKLRLNIACETAEALSYLHNSVVPPIYHRDVKTTNILLDEGFHVKLADFGLSKFVPLKATHVSTAPQGTPGYLDPDYHQCYQLTDKSDVYSFGVVLMELISAKLAVDMSRGRGEINLSTLAVMKIQCGRLEELVDPTLEMQKTLCVERSIKRVVEVAFQCLHAEKDERPSMSFVAETLAKIRREHADDEAEALLNLHINTHSTPTAGEACVSNKPFQHSQDSACSVFFSSTSSSNLSSS